MPDEIATTPSGIRIVYNDANHRYRIAAPGEKLAYVPSVTTVLSKTLPKNLSGWAERKAIEGALKVLREEDLVAYPLSEWTTEELLELMRHRNVRHWQNLGAAASRGTSVHAALELLAGGEIPRVSKFPLSERPYLKALLTWWTDNDPQVEHAEVMVASLAHAYAGRMDLVCRLGERRGIIDLKTSTRVHESHHFQLRAYEIALAESGYGAVDFCAVLRVGNDVAVEFVETWATQAQFLTLLDSYRAQKSFEGAAAERKAAA